MKTIIGLVLASLVAGCVSSARYAALERRTQELEAKDLQQRRANARRDGYQPPGHPALPSQNPSGPAVAGNGVVGMAGMGGQSSTGAMVARRRHGTYMGTVGAQSRQVTMGPKLKLVNHVCDRGSRDWTSQCSDRDRNGAPDYDTYLAFQIDGQPVVCDSPYVHPDTGEVLLAPGQTCYVELGRNTLVDLTIKAYRNFGTTASIMLDAAPDASAHKTVDVGTLTNTGFYEIDESRF